MNSGGGRSRAARKTTKNNASATASATLLDTPVSAGSPRRTGERLGLLWQSFRSRLWDDTEEGWAFKLKAAEVALAAVVLIGTVYIGYKANDILSKQNQMLQSQLATSERLGVKQNQAAVLQAYVSSVALAGYRDEKERRMLHMSLDLYLMLVEDDKKYSTLYTSMPSLTEPELQELLAQRASDKSQIEQLYARRNAVAPAIGPGSPYRILEKAPYQIVIGTFRKPERAYDALVRAKGLLQATSFRPYLTIVQNRQNYFLATLSGFSTRDEVIAAIQREKLPTLFTDVYASQARDWRIVCSARFEACRPGNVQ